MDNHIVNHLFPFHLEASLLFIGFTVAVGQQRADGQDHKGEDAYHCADVVVLLVNGQFVQPSHQQVGGTGGGGQVGDGPAFGQQVDHVEVVHIACEGGDKIRGGDVEHIGQCDFEELLHLVGSVDVRRLVEIGGDVLEHAGELEQGVGYANPDVDDDHRDPGPGGVGKEGQAGIRCNEPQIPLRCSMTTRSNIIPPSPKWASTATRAWIWPSPG